jgi:hypothetical protein
MKPRRIAGSTQIQLDKSVPLTLRFRRLIESYSAERSSGRAWILLIAEAVGLVTFLYCAVEARDLYIEIANIYELGGGEDQLLSFVEWHTYAREAFSALMALWLVAISISAYQLMRSLKSRNRALPYRPHRLLAASLMLPIAGILIGLVFDLFLPGL